MPGIGPNIDYRPFFRFYLLRIYLILARKHGATSTRSFSGDDAPWFTGIYLQEGAAGKTDIDAIVVMDGISNAKVSVAAVYLLRSAEKSLAGVFV